jgi:predicted N-acyltransferase
MHAEFLDSLAHVTAIEWNSLVGVNQPFLAHEFLRALETSACVGPQTGWEPQHLIVRNPQQELIAALPLYRKTDSWGEFVFDFAWADAYRRAGLNYYPKLVAGVPFTPATGARFLYRQGESRADAIGLMMAAIRQQADKLQASSLHVLFPDESEAQELAKQGLLLRKDCQFHWHNAGYQNFDDFLAQFTAAKRKKVRRERRRVREDGVEFRWLNGEQIDTALWEQIMPLYASSFWRRGRDPYLNQAFFQTVARQMPGQLLVILAEKDAEPIATAICFRSNDTLYGRYWGSSGRYHSLHFETCYYQGIDYCIREGLQRFEPGTQGEHKISRGFVPSPTWSAHWLSHPQFAAAVDDYLDRERGYIDEYMDAVASHVPYRQSND